MVSLQALVLTLSVSGAGQTVLLDFYSDSCPPCRQMMPVVAQLEASGYPVQKINVSHQRQAAQQYGVTGVPCFILVSNGKIVDRVVGATSQQRLLQMFAAAGYRLKSDEPSLVAVHPTRSAAPSDGQTWLPEDAAPAANAGSQAGGASISPNSGTSVEPSSLSPSERALACSVRLKINDGDGHSYGTGTIIDTHDGEALVLTCGHIFRASGGKGNVTVDLFDHHGEHTGTVQGQVIRFDMDRDVGLVALRADRKLHAMPVGGPGHRVDRGSRVFSVGCDRGAAPSVRESRVTHINKFLGPANIEVAGAPVDGRSGGGLFTSDGKLIGVCNAADTVDDEGMYAALETIHTELTAANLSFIYTSNEPQMPNNTSQPAKAAAMPRPQDRAPADSSAGLARTRELAAGNSSLPRVSDGDTEVILIVRSKSKPDQRGEVLFIQRPSRTLLDVIAAQRTSPQPTSLQVPASIARGQQ